MVDLLTVFNIFEEQGFQYDMIGLYLPACPKSYCNRFAIVGYDDIRFFEFAISEDFSIIINKDRIQPYQLNKLSVDLVEKMALDYRRRLIKLEMNAHKLKILLEGVLDITYDQN